MTSTFANDLRLNEMATGDQSGSWGTVTNKNLELIGDALGFGTEATFNQDQDKTTTVLDGDPDPARAMYFKVTSTVSGGLTATRKLTIAPDTINRLMFIENATTGGESITIKQGSGSGAAVTIPNGYTKAVILSGSGSGSIVLDAFASLSVDDLLVDDDLTVTGLATVTGGALLNGTTPTLTIGDAGAEDAKIVFDGNAADYHVGLDDSEDALQIGLGAALGTTPRITIRSTEVAVNDLGIDLDFRVESNGQANMLFVDGGNNAVVIGHNDATNGTFASSQALQVVGTSFTTSSVGISRFSADANAGSIIFAKSRAAGIGTDTVVQDNDTLGSLGFSGADGTDLATQGASIVAAVDGTPGGNDMPGRLMFNTTADGNAEVTERMRIDSAGNVLVGRTATADTNVGAMIRPDGFLQTTRSANIAADFNRNTSDGDIVRFSKGSSGVGSIGSRAGVSSYIALDPRTNGVSLHGVGQQLRPGDETGALEDATIDLGGASQRFKDLYLSGGAFLGGTGAANKLDDYEEGTFTPALTYQTPGNSSFGFSTQLGSYTKIGNVCYCTTDLRFNAFSKGNASGALLISSLPFPTANFSNFRRPNHVPNLYQWPYASTDGFLNMLAIFTDGTSAGSFSVMRPNQASAAINDPDADSMLFSTFWYYTA